MDHKFISMTKCLRIRDLEKAEDIANKFEQKTESGVHDLCEISRNFSQKAIISSKESPFPRASAYFASFSKILGCIAQQKSSLQRLNGMGKLK